MTGGNTDWYSLSELMDDDSAVMDEDRENQLFSNSESMSAVNRQALNNDTITPILGKRKKFKAPVRDI